MNRAIILIAAIFIFSCTSNEIGNSKDVNPEAVFFDYEIWAEEGKEDVTINMQYRMGGPNGTTLVLSEPSHVKLDGEKLELDSAKFNGAYYEVQKPFTGFIGKHTISFIDLNKKEYKEEFEFIPFSLSPDVPEVLSRGNIVFQFSGLNPVDYIRVTLTDTSFNSADINDIDTVKNGRLIISADRLSTLKNGPINLQFYKEQERLLKNTSAEGGKLSMTYGLKREFELKDAKNN